MATDYTIPKNEYRALVAERDKLLDGFHAMQQLYEDELKHALAENAKLRELACILAWCAVGADCDKCPINTLDFSEWPNGREICYGADDRMRELGIGIEVGE